MAPITQQQLHKKSIENPIEFWKEASKLIDWYKPSEKIFDGKKKDFPHYQWFPDGVMNTSYNCLDRHVKNGFGDRDALIYDSPVTKTKQRISYKELLDNVSRVATILSQRGIKKGDTVLIYMPMIPQAVEAMLACARIGAVHSVVFGGFAPHEVAKRIEDCKPKALITATCGVEKTRIIPYLPILNEATNLVINSKENKKTNYAPNFTLVYRRTQFPIQEDEWPRFERSVNPYVDYQKAIENIKPSELVEPARLTADDPLYLLYTSGSTGVPKGVVRDNVGHSVALAWTIRYIVGLNPGDVMFCASDVGWVVGHSFIVYGPLLTGCTTIIYEGKPVGTPDPGAFWRVCDEYKASTLFTAPTAVRAIRKEDPENKFMKGYNLSTVRNLFLVGERSDPDTVEHFKKILSKPVRDNWWQTETGFPITVSCEMPTNEGNKYLKTLCKTGASGPAIPGYDIRCLVVDENEDESPEEKKVKFHDARPLEMGNLAIKLPLPPGCFIGLWKNMAKYKSSYFDKFPGYYDTADAGMIDEDEYVSIMSRTDDIINTAGHRLSTGAIEAVIASNSLVGECAVIGAHNNLKGEVPYAFVVMKAGQGEREVKVGNYTPKDSGFVKILNDTVRKEIGGICFLDRCCIVPRLPKTRSGKILRRTLRAIVRDAPYNMPATIEDASVLPEIEEIVKMGPIDKETDKSKL